MPVKGDVAAWRARMCGLMRSCGVCTPASAGVWEEKEKAKRERGDTRSHTPIVA